jgi:hypothetical protein
MTLRLLTTPLLAAGLLLSTLGCSKKDDPVQPPLVGTGSYRYDGALATCQVSASTSSGTITSGPLAGQQSDYLQFSFQPTPQLPSGALVRVEFAKPAGQPNSTYALSSIAYFTDKALTVGKLHSNNTTGTLTELGDGSFSGTFSGTDFSTPSHLITAGTFAGVRP